MIGRGRVRERWSEGVSESWEVGGAEGGAEGRWERAEWHWVWTSTSRGEAKKKVAYEMK